VIEKLLSLSEGAETGGMCLDIPGGAERVQKGCREGFERCREGEEGVERVDGGCRENAERLRGCREGAETLQRGCRDGAELVSEGVLGVCVVRGVCMI
jgi:hypothetical protein